MEDQQWDPGAVEHVAGNTAVKEAGKPRWEWKPDAANAALDKAVADHASAGLSEAYKIIEKQARYARVGEIKKAAIAKLTTDRYVPPGMT